MRTKALLLTAALSAAGVASSVAQTAVYSVNIVGYINKTLSTGLSLIANQLNATPDNKVPTLFGTPSGFVTINKFNAATGNYDGSFWDPENAFWSDPNMVLNPGQGAFVSNQTGAPLPLTFVGEVQLNSSVSVHGGLDIYSSVIPQAGTIDDILFPRPAVGIVTVFQYNNATGQYVPSSYDAENGFWGPTTPNISIGEAFFVDNQSGGSLTWARNFPVGP
jgi:hypothetical protein